MIAAFVVWFTLSAAPVVVPCSCTTDSECAQLCGGNGDPEPVCADGRPFDPYAVDANRDGCTLEPFPD